MANYHAQKQQENDSQFAMSKNTQDAINMAFSKQQMNSARQSPMHYVDLSNPSHPSHPLPPSDPQKQLFIDVDQEAPHLYQHIANSPILKVLPTPKAPQPGCELLAFSSCSLEEHSDPLPTPLAQINLRKPPHVFCLSQNEANRLEQKQLKLPVAELNTPQ